MMNNCPGGNCQTPPRTAPMGTSMSTPNNTMQATTLPSANQILFNSIEPPYPNQNDYTEIDNLPFYQRTDFTPEVPGTTNVPTGTGIPATDFNPTGMGSTTNNVGRAMAGMPAGSLPSQDEVFQRSPLFSVPANPLLPPGYQEILDYGNLQYLNGFLRTQIGKYVRVQQLVGSSVIEDRYGYLVGVGINYILLQEISTGNILVLDFYNIKYVYIYYTKTDLPQNELR